MSIRSILRSTRHDERGMGLVEVVTAFMVFAVIAVATSMAMVSMTRITADSNNREIATNLAAAEIDRIQAISDAFTVFSNNTPGTVSTVNGVNFTVATTVAWQNADGSSGSCGSGGATGGNLQYKRVNVRVTWDNMFRQDPVRADSALAPATRINDPSFGTILVNVYGADGTPRSAITVTATATSGGAPIAAAVNPSDADGCSYILKVVPGTYRIAVSKSNYIDSYQITTPFVDRTVTAGSSTTAQFQYDQQASFALKYAASPASAASQTSTVLTNVASTATVSASYTAPWNRIGSVSDGVRVYSGGANNQVWGSYSGTRPAQQWLQYDWSSPQTLTGASMAFWADQASDTAGDGVAVPSAWKLESWNGSAWVPVTLASPGTYTRVKGSDNAVAFAAPVSTTKLRATFSATTNGSSFAAVAVSEFEAIATSVVTTGAPLLPSNLQTTYFSGANVFASDSTASPVKLHPFLNGYSAVAGKSAGCLDTDPVNWLETATQAAGERVSPAPAAPGGSGTLLIPMGLATVKAPAAGQIIAEQQTGSVNGSPGCASPTTYAFPGTVAANATVMVALPYGSWRLSIKNGAVVTPVSNMTVAGGVIGGIDAVTGGLLGGLLGGGSASGGVVTLDPRQNR